MTIELFLDECLLGWGLHWSGEPLESSGGGQWSELCDWYLNAAIISVFGKQYLNE